MGGVRVDDHVYDTLARDDFVCDVVEVAVLADDGDAELASGSEVSIDLSSVRGDDEGNVGGNADVVRAGEGYKQSRVGGGKTVERGAQSADLAVEGSVIGIGCNEHDDGAPAENGSGAWCAREFAPGDFGSGTDDLFGRLRCCEGGGKQDTEDAEKEN